MPLYAGVDLHANNSYLAVIDDTDELVEARRQPNDIESVRRTLEPYPAEPCRYCRRIDLQLVLADRRTRRVGLQSPPGP